MKKSIFAGIALVAGFASATAPEISLTETVRRSPNSVNVSYVLSGAPAVVTVSFETNFVSETGIGWASIGRGVVKTMDGDVNRVVQPGSRSFTWRARADWPDHVLGDRQIRAVVTARRLSDPPDYVVVDLEKTSDAVTYYETAEDLPGGVGDDAYKTTRVLMRRIHAANVRWRMGASYNDASWDKSSVNEMPHMVSLSQDYYIGVYEFTQRQYELVAGFAGSTIPSAKPSSDSKNLPNADKRPVTHISFDILRGTGEVYAWPQNGHAVSPTLCFGLLRGRYGFAFDLPTCAQWEYAYRAGTASSFFTGDDYTGETAAKNLMDDYSWSVNNTTNDDDGVDYSGMTLPHVVGKKLPNPWGLYDIAGNVVEVCLDWAVRADNAPSFAETVDPVGPANRSQVEANMWSRIWRGGSCITGGMMGGISSHRASSCYTWSGTYRCMGFRICCPAVAH